MLILTCPFCGPRHESEFRYGGPSKPRRPDNPDQWTYPEWIRYLTVPDNPVGLVNECWWHVHGCGKWITVTRHTVTHAIGDASETDREQ